MNSEEYLKQISKMLKITKEKMDDVFWAVGERILTILVSIVVPIVIALAIVAAWGMIDRITTPKNNPTDDKRFANFCREKFGDTSRVSKVLGNNACVTYSASEKGEVILYVEGN